MIEQSQTVYYITYAALCAAVGIAYLKFKSTEGAVITTKEFQIFQSSFLTGYSVVMLCEVIASASFYHTLISVHLNLAQITQLYIVTIIATTLTNVATEIVDFGARKDKCVLSALLYSISMFSLFFGGHYEFLLMGRLVYGAAASLHHTAFEAYAVHEHSSLGFPEDWLGHTFTLLTHCIALMAAVSGVLGQVASSMGHMGCPALCCALFAAACAYMTATWEKDLNSPRFMLSGFLANMNNTLTTVRSNRQVLVFTAITALCEAAILIFSFYWAPWMDTIASEASQQLPYEVIFSTMILASMLGNYLFQMYARGSAAVSTPEAALQGLLVVSSGAYLLGAVFQTAGFALLCAVAVQLCVGGYWPCVGYYRGRLLMHEQRNTVIVLSRLGTLVITVTVLNTVHHSPLLAVCAVLTGAAAYLQSTYMDAKLTASDEGDAESSDEEN